MKVLSLVSVEEIKNVIHKEIISYGFFSPSTFITKYSKILGLQDIGDASDYAKFCNLFRSRFICGFCTETLCPYYKAANDLLKKKLDSAPPEIKAAFNSGQKRKVAIYYYERYILKHY